MALYVHGLIFAFFKLPSCPFQDSVSFEISVHLCCFGRKRLPDDSFVFLVDMFALGYSCVPYVCHLCVPALCVQTTGA